VVGYHVLVIGSMLRRGNYVRLWIGLGALIGVPLFLISSSKALLIRLLFTPMLFRHFLVKPLRMRSVLLFFLAFALLFPVFYAYRALGVGGLDGVVPYLQNTEMPLLKMYNRAYDADSFMRVLHATGEGGVPLQWGRSLVDLFVFFVPRALWPAKPPSFGLGFAGQYMPDVDWGIMTYVSPSLPGELYLDFGLAGVLLGFLGLGWALRAAYRVARRGGPGAVLLYGYFFLAAVHLVEGSIAAQVEFLLMSVVPALLAVAWLRADGRAAPEAERA
jgi:oligosaccharide repeat unit polymerase